jgi:hypothetical protein
MKKINKTKARKLWNERKEFVIVSANLRPEFGLKIKPAWMNQYNTFENFLNHFCAYNCGDAERGRYPVYYVDE